MARSNIRVLALDLDGTLTNNEKIVTPRTRAALDAAAAQGVTIVLASGRPTAGILPLAKELGLEIEIFQSNHEGALIDEVHRAYFEKADGIIINAGGYTHTSVALMDALLAVSLPVIEVHLSDPRRREEFRHRSYVAMAAKGSVVGLGFTGYRRAMELLMALAECAFCKGLL